MVDGVSVGAGVGSCVGKLDVGTPDGAPVVGAGVGCGNVGEMVVGQIQMQPSAAPLAQGSRVVVEPGVVVESVGHVTNTDVINTGAVVARAVVVPAREAVVLITLADEHIQVF